MKKGLEYLRDLTERLLSCESPRPCIDLKKVVAGFKCSEHISKPDPSNSNHSSENSITDVVVEEDNTNG